MKKQVMLFVDDERTILDSLKSQFYQKYGDKYIYEIAEDAEEGFEGHRFRLRPAARFAAGPHDQRSDGRPQRSDFCRTGRDHRKVRAAVYFGQSDGIDRRADRRCLWIHAPANW